MTVSENSPQKARLSKADARNILNNNIHLTDDENNSDSSGPTTAEILKTPRLRKSHLKKLQRQTENHINKWRRLAAQVRKEQDLIKEKSPASSQLHMDKIKAMEMQIEALDDEETVHAANLATKLGLVKQAFREQPNRKRGMALDELTKLNEHFSQHRRSPCHMAELASARAAHGPETEGEDGNRESVRGGTSGGEKESDADNVDDKHSEYLSDDKLMRQLHQVIEEIDFADDHGGQPVEEDEVSLEDVDMELEQDPANVDNGDNQDQDQEMLDDTDSTSLFVKSGRGSQEILEQHQEESVDLSMEDPFVDALSSLEVSPGASKGDKKGKQKKRKRDSMADREKEDQPGNPIHEVEGSEMNKKKKKKRKLEKKSRAKDANTVNDTMDITDNPVQTENPSSTIPKSKKKDKKDKKRDKKRNSELTRRSITAVPVPVPIIPQHSSPFKPKAASPTVNTPIKLAIPTDPTSTPNRKWRFDLPKSFAASLPRFSSAALGASPAHAGRTPKATPSAKPDSTSWVLEGSDPRPASTITMTIGRAPARPSPQASPSRDEKARRRGRPKGSKTVNRKSAPEPEPFTGISTTPVPLPAYALPTPQPAADLIRPVLPAAGRAVAPAKEQAATLPELLKRDRELYQQERMAWGAALNLPMPPGSGRG